MSRDSGSHTLQGWRAAAHEARLKEPALVMVMIISALVFKDSMSVATAVLEKSTPADTRGNRRVTGTNTLLSQTLSVATVTSR